MYRSKEGISGFGRTDGWTDGQPENIMPPAPKGGGIKKNEFFSLSEISHREMNNQENTHIYIKYILKSCWYCCTDIICKFC